MRIQQLMKKDFVDLLGKICIMPQEVVSSARCKAGFGSEAKKPAVGRNKSLS